MSTHPRRPIRPQRRTHPGDAPGTAAPLTRERLLRAALEMIDADGVEALSMRRLGHAVDRDPMRLYRHAESKSALLDAVTELVLADFVVPDVGTTDWESALRACAHTYRRIALAHPKVVPLLVTRPLSTPLGLRPLGTLASLESLLALFVDAGFGVTGALHAYRLFVGFLNGHVLNEVQELVDDPEENDALLRFGLHHLSRKDFPRIRELAPVLADYDGAAELEMGLDIIVGGLRAELAAVTGPVVDRVPGSGVTAPVPGSDAAAAEPVPDAAPLSDAGSGAAPESPAAPGLDAAPPPTHPRPN